MDLLLSGIQVICTPITLMWIFFGTFIGVIFGALPGVSPTMAVVLSIGFTYSMEPVVAIAFLAAIYCSSITGGGITAIIFKIPGTPSSAATVLDGFPMAQRGEAGRALGISLICSSIGGLFSALVMFFLTQPLMKAALQFSAAELFAVCVLGLSIIVLLDKDKILSTLTSVVIGLWLATIGMDEFSTVPRFTFGIPILLDGMDSLPFMLGMFAAVEVYKEIHNPTDRSMYQNGKQAKLSKLAPLKDYIDMKWTIIRSALLGTAIGIIPGAGSTIAAWLSYTTEKKLSKNPELLGTGVPNGIAAPETANNAATGGAMVPMLAMGIPGSNAAAAMMAALAIHGVQMGPLLLKAQPQYLSATFISMIIANIAMVFISIVVAKTFASFLALPYWALGIFIMIMTFCGCYASKNGMVPIYVMLIGSIIGYFLSKFNFNIPSLILGLVLGPICERQFRRGMQMSNNDIIAFFSRPITLTLMIIIILVYAFSIYKMFIAQKKED